MKILSYQCWLSQSHTRRLFFFIMVVALVVYVGSQPGSDTGGEENYFVSYFYNLAHQPMFALVALSFLLLLNQECRSRYAFLLGGGFALLLGIYDELQQARIPFRASSIWDLGSDVLGATFGILVARWSDLRGGVFDFLLPIACLLFVSLLWNFFPTFATQYSLPFTG